MNISLDNCLWNKSVKTFSAPKKKKKKKKMEIENLFVKYL